MVEILRQSAGKVTPRMLSLLPLPAFEDNYIWTLTSGDGSSIVVDPGDATPVLQAASQGCVPVAILITHHHPDHIGGVAELLNHFDIPCYAPVDARIPLASQRVADGDLINIPELAIDLTVMAVSGHTLSHVAYAGAGIVFCGDTLFSLGCGRLFEGTPAQMLASLDRLSALPETTQVCCTHEYTLSNGRFACVAEPHNAARDQRIADVNKLRAQDRPSLPSTIASERDCNPFLRIDQLSVRTTLETRAGMPLNRQQAFAALREWKDTFRG